MSVTKLRNSTAIDETLAVAAVSAALRRKYDDDNQVKSDRPTKGALPAVELTADDLGTYLRPMLANSCNSIDALLLDLRQLRERLMVDAGAVEQGIAEFKSLNQAILKLTEIVSQGVTHIQAPGIAV
jgi:hypothetical protein